MDRLPIDITINILSRLPVRSVLGCRCVCKTWCSLVDNPQFPTIHFNASVASNPSSSSSSFIFVPAPFLGELYIVDNEEARSTSTSKEGGCILKSSSKIKLTFPDIAFTNIKFSDEAPLFSVGFSNGLLCFSSYEGALGKPDRFFYICNPAIGESLRLQDCNFPTFRASAVIGFGFVPSTKEFKVVDFFYWRRRNESIRKSEAYVYTLGSSTSWRNIRSAPRVIEVWDGTMLFVNGSLHFIAFDDSDDPIDVIDGFRPLITIVSFDLEHERFGIIPNPALNFLSDPEFVRPYKVDYPPYHFHLGVLEDCLAFSDSSSRIYYDIWVMKEYSVKESWTKQFVIPMDFTIETSIATRNFPISFRKNGELVLLCNYHLLLSHNLEYEEVEELKDQAFPFVGSLISPS